MSVRHSGINRSDHFHVVGACTDLLTAPQSQNVTLGDTARFSCGGTGTILSWSINQVTLNETLVSHLGISHSEFKTDGAVFSNISIPANEGFNNSEVYCTVYKTSLVNRQSNTAILRVQGALSFLLYNTFHKVDRVHRKVSASWVHFALRQISSQYR